MNKLFYLFFFIISVIQAQTTMTESEALELKKRVKLHANSTQSITSDFIQYKHLDFLTNDIITKGELSFKAPDLIKWHYTSPYNYAVLFKDDVLHINDEGKKSNLDLSSNKQFKQLNLLIVNSVKGDLFNEDQFSIKYVKNGLNPEAQFSPKDSKFATYIKEFHIKFNAIGDVTEIKMIEPSNDYTRIVFSNKKINIKLSNEVFSN